jgi:hypothetical protein
MRPLDELLAAYRTGSRSFLREFTRVARDGGYGAEVVSLIADAVLVLADEYSVRVATGYSDEQLASASAAQMGRAHLVRRMILRSHDRDVLMTMARGVGWEIPERVATVAVRGSDWESVSSPPDRLLAGPIEELICVIVPDPGPSPVAEIERSLGGLPAAVVGPTVPVAEAAVSFGRAAAVIRFAPADAGLVEADRHLFELALLDIDGRLAADFADRQLGVLAELGPRAEAKVTATLRAWLSHHGRYEATAAALGVHPQTVRYRLDQARGALGGALDDPQRRDEVRLALQLRDVAGDQTAQEALRPERRSGAREP